MIYKMESYEYQSILTINAENTLYNRRARTLENEREKLFMERRRTSEIMAIR